MSEPLLRIEDLQVHFRLGREAGVERRVQAVGRNGRGVSFDVPEHRTVALVFADSGLRDGLFSILISAFRIMRSS